MGFSNEPVQLIISSSCPISPSVFKSEGGFGSRKGSFAARGQGWVSISHIRKINIFEAVPSTKQYQSWRHTP